MTPWLQDPDVTLYHGDCLQVLRELPSSSVHMCATSPPFYGLRDYGTEGQIGLEDTPDEWVQNLVAVFREVRRVLRDDGTLWVEIGDSYCANQGRDNTSDEFTTKSGAAAHIPNSWSGSQVSPIRNPNKPKDLLGQPWLLAFALRADGWWLRSEIIWARPNPMPESVTDRPTKSHSTVFLLSKQPRYFYDADAIREPHAQPERGKGEAENNNWSVGGTEDSRGSKPMVRLYNPAGANARSVWTIPTQPTPFAHFATWPEQLCRRMILAGTSERGCCPECGSPWVRETSVEYVQDKSHANGRFAGETRTDRTDGTFGGPQSMKHGRANKVSTTTGWQPSCECGTGQSASNPLAEGASPSVLGGDSGVTREPGLGEPPTSPLSPIPCTVLDPFAGSATTNLVARNHGRHSIGIELNENYLKIAGRRLQQLTLLA